MRFRAWFGVPAIGALLAASAAAPVGPAQEGPTLVVMVVVDQLRGDLVERYSDAFTGGFRRLLDQGFRFTSASHAHAVTQTAAGHATLSTGTFPSRSGIVANNWSQRRGDNWVPMYSVEDRDSPILGAEAFPGRSPRNLQRTGLADWVLAASPDARAVSVSGKDRASITLAGQSRAETYWVIQELGRFVTSTYYRSAYPGWVEDFNRDVMSEIMADTIWADEVPERFRALARPDSAAYERDGVHTTFPHVASAEVPPSDTAEVWQATFNVWALEQPRMDRAIERFAERALEEQELGRRGVVDFLAVSFSATDYVGHDYGPLGREQLDNLIRLDAELGRLFDFLDDRVGEGRWVVGFSADHGVMTMPEWTAARGGTTRRVLPSEAQAPVAQALRDAAAEGTEPPEAFQRRLAGLLEERGLVARAYPIHDLTRGVAADSFATLARNSWYPGRATGWLTRFGVEFRWPETLLVDEEHGTTHGTPYWYDRHVPLVLMGPGIAPGQSDVAAYTVDLAPTLARLAGISVPDDLDGRAIYPW